MKSTAVYAHLSHLKERADLAQVLNFFRPLWTELATELERTTLEGQETKNLFAVAPYNSRFEIRLGAEQRLYNVTCANIEDAFRNIFCRRKK